ncbi:MAG: DUF2961 domain-containing protein [Caldilinea sp.]|jgi:hypothetical protein|nr:DUF2961 domain-containing protein [Caldilinea sp.]
MTYPYNGLGLGLGNLARVSNAETRSISAENFTGEKGKGGMATEGTGAVAARELGHGWKLSPCITVQPNNVVTLAEINGSGAIQQIWITVHPKFWRSLILRMYWDAEETPSVEVPLGDFFCMGWCERADVRSLPIAVNPAGGFNSYWEMPFRTGAKITVENLLPDAVEGFFYQINYTLTEVEADRAYFHAQFRRQNPLPYKEVYTILDGVRGQGHYVGVYIAWGVNNNLWWGEGEVKFYLDGDTTYPTICGTGTEDYFGGAWGFEQPPGHYGVFTSPFSGMPQVLIPDGLNKANTRFGLYRWHVMDPVRFKQECRITLQALGWRMSLNGKPRYLALQDDIASTAFWYQVEPHAPFPPLPNFEFLEVI